MEMGRKRKRGVKSIPEQYITYYVDENGNKKELPHVLKYKEHHYNITKGGHYTRCIQSLLHRVVWEEVHGPIPKGYVIHHKDCDPSNNDITNLQLMKNNEHVCFHKELRCIGQENNRDIPFSYTVYRDPSDNPSKEINLV